MLNGHDISRHALQTPERKTKLEKLSLRSSVTPSSPPPFLASLNTSNMGTVLSRIRHHKPRHVHRDVVVPVHRDGGVWFLDRRMQGWRLILLE
jgi:hypothetical protein